jgi:hypothetical protein
MEERKKPGQVAAKFREPAGLKSSTTSISARLLKKSCGGCCLFFHRLLGDLTTMRSAAR